MFYKGRHFHRIKLLFFQKCPKQDFFHNCVKVCDIKNLLPSTLPHRISNSKCVHLFSVDIEFDMPKVMVVL